MLDDNVISKDLIQLLSKKCRRIYEIYLKILKLLKKFK